MSGGEGQGDDPVAISVTGLFSLGGHPDHLLIEYCVQFDPIFDQVSYKGVPDIRIIVFLGYPVMAMIRLPTRLYELRRRKADPKRLDEAAADLRTGKTAAARRILDGLAPHAAASAGVTSRR